MKKIITVIIAAVTFALSLCGCDLLSGFNEKQEYESVLSTVYTSIATCNGERYFKAMAPCYSDFFKKYNGVFLNAGFKNMYEVMTGQLKTMYGDVYGEMQLSHVIKSDNKMDDSQIKQIEDDMNSFAATPVKIEEGVVVISELTITGSKKSEVLNHSAHLVKIDGEWYVYIPGFSDIAKE